jgi:hypothetical protein
VQVTQDRNITTTTIIIIIIEQQVPTLAKLGRRRIRSSKAGPLLGPAPAPAHKLE